MASGDLRLFVAVPVPADAVVACDERLAPLRERYPEARWIPAEYRHLTLVFLGAVAPSRVADLERDIEVVAEACSAFEMALTSGSGRPGRGGDGVVWLSAGRGGERAAGLATALHHRMRADDPRQPAGGRPHVTVARRASAALIAEMKQLSVEPPIQWHADRIVLFRSHLGPPGARYERVFERALALR